MSEYVLLVLGAILVGNFVLSRFLGICPFLGVSKRLDTAMGMAAAVTLVMTLAAAVTWLLERHVLVPFGLEALQTLVFILVIATLVQLVAMVLRKFFPPLYRALGVRSFESQEDFTAGAKADRSHMVNSIVSVLFGVIDSLAAAPVTELTSRLPGIADYLQNVLHSTLRKDFLYI